MVHCCLLGVLQSSLHIVVVEVFQLISLLFIKKLTIQKLEIQRLCIEQHLDLIRFFGVRYYPKVEAMGAELRGIASWYGPNFHAKKTSNGEIYNMYAMTAAHKTLPMNTMVRVDNLENGRSAIVRINDRGPFVAGRIIDLSNKAAHKIDMVKKRYCSSKGYSYWL